MGKTKTGEEAERHTDAQKAVVVKGVALSLVDWRFLELLGKELKAKGLGRATASAAIRRLLEDERRRPGRVEGELAVFDVGVDGDGKPVGEGLDLRTGATHYIVRASATIILGAATVTASGTVLPGHGQAPATKPAGKSKRR